MGDKRHKARRAIGNQPKDALLLAPMSPQPWGAGVMGVGGSEPRPSARRGSLDICLRGGPDGRGVD